MVIDFGFAGHIPTASYRFTDHPGSVCYAAPELLGMCAGIDAIALNCASVAIPLAS